MPDVSTVTEVRLPSERSEKTAAELSRSLYKDAQSASSASSWQSKDSSKDLQYLEIPDCPYPKQNDKLENDKLPSPKSSEKSQEWAVAINLACNGDDVGSQAKLKQLKELADQTKDKPVSLYVQSVKPSETKDSSTANKSETIERYLIKDGRWEKQEPDIQSEGYAKDVASLVKWAGNDDQAKKLMLVTQSHGMGANGLGGDDGRTDIQGFTDSIKASLKECGREKLDMLDFDACLMAEKGVLDKVKNITTNLVASSETERAEPGLDGQDPKRNIQLMLDNPSMNADELGNKIVNSVPSLSQDKRNTSDSASGTETLAHFDLDHIQDFDKAVNDFGQKLSAVMQDKDSKQAIEQAISILPRFNQESDPMGTTQQRRDLKSFVEKVQSGITNGSIKDTNGELKRSITSLTEASQKLITAYHGETNKNEYDKQGGLSILLPEKDFINDESLAKKTTSIAQMKALAESDTAKRPESLDELQQLSSMYLSEIKKEVPPARQSELTALTESVKAVMNAQSPDQILAAANQLKDASVNLYDSSLNKEVAENRCEMVERLHKVVYEFSIDPSDKGYNSFLNSLGVTVTQ